MSRNGKARPPLPTEDRATSERAASKLAVSDAETTAVDGTVGRVRLAQAVCYVATPETGRVLDRLAEAVADVLPYIRSGALSRTAVIASLTLAAESVAVARRSAEQVICAALRRGAE